MILPISVYGDPILRKKCKEVPPTFENLDELIKNMFDTMYQALGVGIAAPQIGLDLKLFVVDAAPFAKLKKEKAEPYLLNFKKVFINPNILKVFGKKHDYKEGCLSIPGIEELISRKNEIEIEYFDENWQKHKEKFSGMASKIIQHEYDHLEGKLFIDYLLLEKRKQLKNLLQRISKGKIKTDYKLNIPIKKNK